VPPARIEGSALRITLVNHSTVLIQQHGVNILTDPIWSERTSPYQWIGPRRKRIPGVAWEHLPPIHLVLLSHNHYDHLDLPTLRRLAARQNAPYIVPRGCAPLLHAEKIGPAHELDWGDSLPLAGCTIHSVPALHSAARSLRDRNRSLWCGYIIESSAGLVYFAADTAFGPHFAQIRERFGAPRLALLPIGAYEPRWFMSPIHMNPEEAVRAHRILEPTTSIAIHHGTFQLADESIDAPKEALAACAGSHRFLVLNNGEFADLP